MSATGRAWSVLPDAVVALIETVGIEYFVTVNGQYNYHSSSPLVQTNHRIISHFPMSSAQVEVVTALLAATEVGYGYVTQAGIVVLHESTHLIQALSELHIAYDFVHPAVVCAHSMSVYQILAFYAHNHDINLPLPHNLKTVRWHISGVDILEKNGSKARGIASVLSDLHITAADAAAFGDGLNDLEMLKFVGTGVAMGNAHPDLKAVADVVCPDIRAHGIYRGLQDLGWI